MAYLVAPQPSLPDLPVFFNVEGVVGAPPAQNRREDVLFVQFVFEMIARQPLSRTPADLLTAAKAVKATGNIDPATINAIRTLQRTSENKNAVVDGRVSPAKDGYSYGVAAYSIANLNNSLQDRCVDVWPRIDKIASCPAELRTMIVRTVAGT